ncbi:MAG: hypothetical protein ACODAJ_00930 [Planctomycetota bacterium]
MITRNPVAAVVLFGAAATALCAEARRPAWETAWRETKPMTVEETKAFMKRLATFVFDHHLKQDPGSPQRGMIYEYFDVTRDGKADQFVQGEGLDTMHDGAWFAAALVNAWRATGDPWYKAFLAEWVLPFYLKMLNHSDELFTTQGAVVREGGRPWGKPWAFQEGEKGFIPYWWDDGGSVSLERRRSKEALPIRPSIDHTVGKPNPKALLDGYSLGMSNHMAQDIGVMLQLAWLMFKDGDTAADRKLAAELAEAAKNLHESRVRHFGFIPMCVAPAALANGDAKLMRRVPKPQGDRYWTAGRHYRQALRDYEPDKRYAAPGFADDQQYRYYYGLARTGGTLTDALAFKTIADAYTEPQLFRYYCDDWEVPPGINKFDLHALYFVNGKPLDYRSDRRGPGGRPRPIGSRFGPQNMVCCGWALQILRDHAGLWAKGRARGVLEGLAVDAAEPKVKAWLERELGGGLRTWEAILDAKGYIPTGIGTGQHWDRFSDSGGYAHLLSAAAQWILYLEGKSDWEVHGYPAILEAAAR